MGRIDVRGKKGGALEVGDRSRVCWQKQGRTSHGQCLQAWPRQQDGWGREAWESALHQEAPLEVDATPETSTCLKCLFKKVLVLVYFYTCFFLITKSIHVHQKKIRKSKNYKKANFHLDNHPQIFIYFLPVFFLCIQYIHFPHN